MSEKLGPLTFETEPASPFLGMRPAPRAALYSERTAEAIDQDVEALVTAAHDTARKILERERPLLERLAAALLEREALEGGELARLLEAEPSTAPTAAAGGARAVAFNR
jgi:cell division protease FtsH